MLKKKDDEGLKVPTRQRLIELAIAELDANGASGFDIEDLLTKSNISKGSLYHHFRSKNGLIVAAEVHLLLATYDQGNRLLRLLVENTKDADEFSSHLELMVRTATNKESEETRRRRIRALALAQHNPTLAQEIQKARSKAATTWQKLCKLPLIKAGYDQTSM